MLGCINSSTISNNAGCFSIIRRHFEQKWEYSFADDSSGIDSKSMHVDDLDFSKAHIYYIINTVSIICSVPDLNASLN